MSVGTAIDALQSAVQKLKAGFDDFEIDLQKVRKRTLREPMLGGPVRVRTTQHRRRARLLVPVSHSGI